MNNPFMKSAIALSVVLALSACGGGGGGGNDSGPDTGGQLNDDGETLSDLTRGFSLPSEISAVPTENGEGEARSVAIRSLGGALRALSRAASDLSEESDYHQAVPRKFVEEKALEQFDIIEQVLNAIGQTHYADEENINNGPYKAMIAWEEEENGRDVKTLQPWVIDSRMIVDEGPDGDEVDVNRVLAWIEEAFEEDGQVVEQLIKAEFRIYEAAEVLEDGAYANYGEWDMNVSFDDGDGGFFTASARILDDDSSEIKVHENFNEGEDFTYVMKGILVRSGTTGFGKVQFPDWHQCFEPDCAPPAVTAQYAYNQAYLAVAGDGDPESVIYKDRDVNNALEMVHRYKLFHAAADTDSGVAAGDDVERHQAFGFPITFDRSVQSGDVFTEFGYYGAWQGRHEIWGPEGIDAGTVVTREDRSGENAETFVVSAPFNGTFTRRELVEGSLDDILGVAVETWVNEHYDLFYSADNGAWGFCDGYMDWQWDEESGTWNTACRDFSTDEEIAFDVFENFGALAMDDSGRKWVNIGRWDENAGRMIDYIYLTGENASNGDGFYEAQWGDFGLEPIEPAVKYDTPADGDSMWVDIGGSIYIEYTGEFGGVTTTGWVQKTLEDFDEQTWTPTFSENDAEFDPEHGQEYYINASGANFVVKRVGEAGGTADDYEVGIELQSAANPVNFEDILPPNTAYLRTPWRPEVRYALVTNPAEEDFLKLVYATDDPNTEEDEVGTVYTSGEWGLQAYNAGGQPLDGNGDSVPVDEWGFPSGEVRPMEFNWEYAEGDFGWGIQQFLCSPDCSSVDNYVLLSDPIQFSHTFNAGTEEEKTFLLQFDGWMHGMPDLYHELERNDWDISAVADKVFNISAGTEVSDGDTAYYVKPMETSVFLKTLSESEVSDAEVNGVLPDITAAGDVDLNTVPDFTDHGMGPIPTDTVVKYSEGKPVDSL